MTVGTLNTATAMGAVAVGQQCSANGDYSFAQGQGTKVFDGASYGYAIGNGSNVSAQFGYAAGY